MAATLALLTLAALVAGAVNAMAGGGTFVTFPMLTGVAHLSEKAANITSTVGLWPGYAASVAAAWEPLRALGRRTLLAYVLLGLVGGLAGAVLLLTTPTTAFAKVVPWLLALGTTLLAAGPAVNRWAGRAESGARTARPLSFAALAVVLVVAVYNGYFGAGGGVLMLAGLAVVMPGDVRRINVLKVVIQVSANSAAIGVFLTAGVHWRIAAAMAVGSVVGGFVGMRLANRVPPTVLRATILVVASALTVAYFVKAYG
jgi:uncharacterized membrane protein YfcA